MEHRKKEKQNDILPFTVYFWFGTCSFSNSAFIPLFICFICLFAPSVYKRHSFPSGSGIAVHWESFIMGWKSWGEGPAALWKPSERSSGWQHHLQPTSRFLFELFALAELADLMAGFAVATAAALFAVNPAPARWTQAASLPLFLPIGADGRRNLALRLLVFRCARHMRERPVSEEHSRRRHYEQPRVIWKTPAHSAIAKQREVHHTAQRIRS